MRVKAFNSGFSRAGSSGLFRSNVLSSGRIHKQLKMADGIHTKASVSVNLQALNRGLKKALDDYVMIPIFNSDCTRDEYRQDQTEMQRHIEAKQKLADWLLADGYQVQQANPLSSSLPSIEGSKGVLEAIKLLKTICDEFVVFSDSTDRESLRESKQVVNLQALFEAFEDKPDLVGENYAELEEFFNPPQKPVVETLDLNQRKQSSLQSSSVELTQTGTQVSNSSKPKPNTSQNTTSVKVGSKGKTWKSTQSSNSDLTKQTSKYSAGVWAGIAGVFAVFSYLIYSWYNNVFSASSDQAPTYSGQAENQTQDLPIAFLNS